MKTLITIFTLILTWVFNAVANNNEPINPSASFYLDAETIPSLKEQSFSGDKNAAIKLANYYSFYLKGDDNFHTSCIYLYISAILGNETAEHNLYYLINRKKLYLKDLFLFFGQKPKLKEESEDLLDNFISYHYCLEFDKLKAESYLKFLKSKKVDERLLKKYIFQDGKLILDLCNSNLQAKENKDFVLPSNVYKLSPSEVQTAEAKAINGDIDALEKLGLYYTWHLQDELSTLKGEAILAMRADLGDAQATKALAKINKKDLSLKLEKYTETLKEENSVLSDYILQKFCENNKLNSSNNMIYSLKNKNFGVSTKEKSLEITPQTAVKIAEIILSEIYGESRIKALNKETPWKVIEEKDSFLIKGNLPPMTLGGVPEIEIRKRDGAVLRYLHSK